MDFMERLKDKINDIWGLPIECKLGYLSGDESLVLYPLPGSNVVEEFYDGTREENLLYEIAMKSKSQEKINSTLWMISRSLQEINEIKSNDESFTFNSIIITNLPFINSADDQGWYTFLVDVRANITNYEKRL